VGAEQERLERDIFQQRMQLGDDVDALVEKVSPGQAARRQVGRIGNSVTTVKDRVMGQASDLGSSAGDRVSAAKDSAVGLKDSAVGLKDSAADTASSSTDAAKRRTEGNPLAAGLIAFGVGWLVSSLLPASPVEERAGAALREHAEEPVKAAGQQLGEKAKELGEHLREPAQHAAESVKQTATDAAQEVKDRAGAHAGNLTSEAKDRAQSVQETAQSS
jgi:predicted ribonuclease toxin of YeeF-YezG toxin-antitoxin module